MGGMSRSAILTGALLLMIVAIAVVRFLVHELIKFVEISAVMALIILVLAWLIARKSAPSWTNRP